jgi:UDP:flavonoid glycosyltransferase YjiC (YdhE family)
MKILIASTNAPGHLNPLLAVAVVLRKHNHEVVVQGATAVRPIVEAAGLPFHPFLPEADVSVSNTSHPTDRVRGAQPAPGVLANTDRPLC